MTPLPVAPTTIQPAELIAALRLQGTSPGMPTASALLLVGAGCSLSAGIPLASTIAEDLAKHYAESCGIITHNPTQLLDIVMRQLGVPGVSSWSQAFPHLFSHAMPHEVQQTEFLLPRINTPHVNWTHACIAQLLVAGVCNPVLTTNFDLLLPRSLLPHGVVPIIADGPQALSRLSPTTKVPQIGFLHGSITSYSISAATESLSDQNAREHYRNCLAALLHESSCLIVVGYSGNDIAIMQAIAAVVSTYPTKVIYWVTNSASFADLSPNVQRLLASCQSSRLILDQDSDEFFDLLMCELISDVPAWMARPHDVIYASGNALVSSSRRGHQEIDSLRQYLRSHEYLVSPYDSQFAELQLANGAVKEYARRRLNQASIRSRIPATLDPFLRAIIKADRIWRANLDAADATVFAQARRALEEVAAQRPIAIGEDLHLRYHRTRSALCAEYARRTHDVSYIDAALDSLSLLHDNYFQSASDIVERIRLINDFLQAIVEKLAAGSEHSFDYVQLAKSGIADARRVGDWYMQHSIAINYAMVFLHSTRDLSEADLSHCISYLEEAFNDYRLSARPTVLAKALHNCAQLYLQASEDLDGDNKRRMVATAVSTAQQAVRVRSICDDPLRYYQTLLVLAAIRSESARQDRDSATIRSTTDIAQLCEREFLNLRSQSGAAKAKLQVAINHWNAASIDQDAQGLRRAHEQAKALRPTVLASSPGALTKLDALIESQARKLEPPGPLPASPS